jgi:hypothetical protein
MVVGVWHRSSAPIGKAREKQMRRSFKVATVFAGMTALTGGYAPAALAATTPAAVRGPDITPRLCGSTTTHWVHLYYPHNGHPPECFGFEGSTPVNATISAFCPGNNNGSYSTVAYGNVSFGHSGTKIPYGTAQHMYRLDIFSWSGNDTCPST